jgi:hypothetical protein
MDERSRVLTAACAGAAIGGLWAWMNLTESGRRVRGQIDPAIGRLIDELEHVREAAEKAKAAVNEGRQLLTDITGSLRELPRQSSMGPSRGRSY